MKKIVFLLITSFSFSFVQAQSNIIKVNPLGIISESFEPLGIAFEHAVNDETSVLLGVNSSLYIYGYSVSTVSAELAFRHYFSKKNNGLEGFFFSPFLEIFHASYEPLLFLSTRESVFTIGGGGKGGYQWVFGNGLALDLFLGYGYHSFKFKKFTDKGMIPSLGLALGYNF